MEFKTLNIACSSSGDHTHLFLLQNKTEKSAQLPAAWKCLDFSTKKSYKLGILQDNKLLFSCVLVSSVGSNDL
jgi:hypothetical protein